MFRRTFLLGVLLLAGLQSAVAESAASPPQGVVAVKAGNFGWLSWLPPSQGSADFYYVYGISGGDRYFLFETTELYAPVSASYAGFAVSAVKNGVESTAVPACGVTATLNPPPPAVYPNIACV